jgi:hypothetical protein
MASHKMSAILQSLLALVVIFPLVSPLYFHIAETERKCFIEEIPDETMVTGNYKVQLYDPRSATICQPMSTPFDCCGSD